MPTEIPEGHGLIPGRGTDNAKAAIAAAEAAGVDVGEVRTVEDGYLVPEKVLKQYEAGLKKASEPASKSPEKPAAKKPASKKS